MAKKPETILEETCAIEAELRGIGSRKLEWIGRRGAPDRLFVGKGKLLLVEFKILTGRLSPAQVQEHTWFRKYGYKIAVVNSLNQFVDLIEEFFGV